MGNASRYMVGGVTTETRCLLRGLVATGHTVGLVTDAPFNLGEVVHHPIGGGTSSELVHALKRALLQFSPDVVHVMLIGSTEIINISPVLAKCAWVFTCHSLPPYERKWHGFHGNEALHYAGRALRFATNTLAWQWLLHGRRIPHIVAHSHIVQSVLTRYGYGAEHVSVIPLGFDITASDNPVSVRTVPSQRLRLLTIAGLAHTKGQHDVIAALPSLCERFGSVEYKLIGEVRDTTYVAYLHKLAASLGVSQCLIITPNVSEAEKLQALASADVYVQPSHEEGFCLAYIEAAAVVPRLVGADTGAIAAISASDEGARVVPVRSPKALAAAITDLLERPLPASLMQQRIERLGGSFGWDGYIAAHEKLYCELIAAHPSSR